MHPIFQKTLGGLSPQYYFRQLFFSLLIFGLFVFMSTHSPNSTPIGMWFYIVISTLLYPYSRFVYESIVGFVMGENVFFLNAIVMLFAKLVTMMMCWAFAIFLSPIGLAYLYYHHSKEAR